MGKRPSIAVSFISPDKSAEKTDDEREREKERECLNLFGSFGKFLKYHNKVDGEGKTIANYTVEDSLALLLRSGGDYFQENYEKFYGDDGIRLNFPSPSPPLPPPSSSSPSSSSSPHFVSSPPSSWANPLASQLPLAPDLKIYCLYGIQKMTERGYEYTDLSSPFHLYYKWKETLFRTDGAEGEGVGVREDGEGEGERGGEEERRSEDVVGVSSHLTTLMFLAGNLSGSQNGSSVFLEMDVSTSNVVTPSGMDCLAKNGVRNSDGDGTVPLLSLGYMCVKVHSQSDSPNAPFLC